MENEVQQVISSVKPLPQNQTLTPTPPLTNWSKILLFTLLGLIVITGSVFAGIQIGKNQTPSQEPTVMQTTISPTQTAVNPTDLPVTPSPTTDPTAEWKTYANEKYGFSFHYPQSAMLTDAENKTYLISDELTNFTPGDNTAKIYIYLNSKAQGWAGGGIEPDYIIQKIDNIDAKRYSTTREMDPSEKLDIVTFSRNGVYYYIALSWYKNDKSTIQIFDQILSTFKFTN